MREIRTSGSEGGGTEPNRSSLPLSRRFAQDAGRLLPPELVEQRAVALDRGALHEVRHSAKAA